MSDLKCAVVAVVLHCSCAAVDPVQGVVVGEDGRPIVDAIVALTTPDGERRRIRTDAHGHFVLERLAGAELSISADGFGSFESATTADVSRIVLRKKTSQITGVGILIEVVGQGDSERLEITEILECGAARRSDQLRVGDRLIAVDGFPARVNHRAEAQRRIRGADGTLVTLLVERGGVQSSVVLRRETLLVPCAPTAKPDPDRDNDE